MGESAARQGGGNRNPAIGDPSAEAIEWARCWPLRSGGLQHTTNGKPGQNPVPHKEMGGDGKAVSDAWTVREGQGWERVRVTTRFLEVIFGNLGAGKVRASSVPDRVGPNLGRILAKLQPNCLPSGPQAQGVNRKPKGSAVNPVGGGQ